MFGKLEQLSSRGGIIFYFPAVLIGLSLMSCSLTPLAEQAEKNACPDPGEVNSSKMLSKKISVRKTVPEPLKEEPGFGLPLTFFNSADFVGSGRCSFCHGNLRDGAGRNMSINDHWRSTMMANAAKDPLWRAKVASETARSPEIKNIIEKKCVTCHMPMAWTQYGADKDGYDKAEPESIYDSFSSPDSVLHKAALDGVSCSLCHQIRDKDLGTDETFSGKFPLETGAKAPDRPIFGPYKESVVGPMQVSVGFTPEYGIHTNDSALCATCHTLYTPYLDGDGKIAGTFPEQTPYLEWLHSDYAEEPGERHDISEEKEGIRTCQECHMPHSKEGDVLIANPSPPEAKVRDHFSRHHFVGGNVFLLNILHDNISSLSLSTSSDKLKATRMRTIAQLQNDTASLEILDSGIEDGILFAEIKVENLVGHKFPTGFPTRRAWFNFKVLDGTGDLVFESGRLRPDGSIVGDNTDEGKGYEPHYEIIDRPEKVQIYESTMVDTDGEVTFTLLRAAGYLKDNRLLPRGFDKSTAGADIGVYGEAVRDDDFSGGEDKVRYEVDLEGYEGPFIIKSALNYTTVSHAFMEDLRKDEMIREVGRFAAYYDKADKSPVTVASDACVVR